VGGQEVTTEGKQVGAGAPVKKTAVLPLTLARKGEKCSGKRSKKQQRRRRKYIHLYLNEEQSKGKGTSAEKAAVRPTRDHKKEKTP